MKAYNQWASKLGFIMATAGAAVGLGNLWKFPYLMGRNGGFPFLIAYLIFVCVLGVPVMITEMSLGRKTRHDPVQAYADIYYSFLLQCHRRMDFKVYCKLCHYAPCSG